MDQVDFELKRPRRQRLLPVAILICWVALLGACSNVMPAVTSATHPAPTSPAIAAPAQPQPAAPSESVFPAASPTSGTPRRVPDALLSPADLTFNAAYPAAGWHRCDDYYVDRNLERYRSAFKVRESAAAIWEYGSKCSSADQKARLDEYAWRLQNIDAVLKLSDDLVATASLDQQTSQSHDQVRQFERDAVWVRTLPVESKDGKRQYVAEIVGQAGRNVVYMRITTATALTDEDYLGMARLCLDRLAAGEGAR